jgi:hypothetical protein
MNKTVMKKVIDYGLGFLMMVVSLQLLITVITDVTALAAGSPLSEIITMTLVNFIPVLGFSAFIWLPLSLICGHMYMKHGVKKALRFTLYANLGLIAAVIILRGTCWAMTM